jgi:hypothetical protein
LCDHVNFLLQSRQHGHYVGSGSSRWHSWSACKIDANDEVCLTGRDVVTAALGVVELNTVDGDGGGTVTTDEDTDANELNTVDGCVDDNAVELGKSNILAASTTDPPIGPPETALRFTPTEPVFLLMLDFAELLSVRRVETLTGLG